MTPSTPPILRLFTRLRALRRVLIRGELLHGAAWALAVGAGVLLLASVSLGVIPAPGPRAAGLAVLVLGPMLALLWAARGALRWRDLRAVAARAEDAAPALRSDVRTALGFAARREAPGDEADLRRQLRERLTARVARELDNRRDELAQAVRGPGNDRPVRVAGLALATLAVLASFGPAAVGDGLRYLLFAQPPVSGAHALVEEQNALIEPIRVTLLPPAYTGLATREVRGTLGDFRALVGTEVSWRTRSLIPVTQARLRLGTTDDAIAVPLEVLEGGVLQGVFTATESVSYQVELRAEDGPWRVDPRHRRLAVEADQPPTVELAAPDDGGAVAPDEVIQFVYAASDDFGLRSVRLVWHFEGDEERRREITLHTGLSTRSIEDQALLDLADLRLQPRDVVVSWIEATDNDTISGPNVGRSRPVLLRVAAPDELNLEILALKQTLFDQTIQQLGGMLPVTLNRWVADAERTRLRAQPRLIEETDRRQALDAQLGTQAGWAEILALWNRLVERMADDVYSAERDRELLAMMHGRLHGLERDHAAIALQAEALGRTPGVPAALWNRAIHHDAEHVSAAERAVLLLDDLLAAHRQELVARTLEELQETRERLRELIERLRETDDPELREQILDEIARLDARMRELMQRMRDQVDQAPPEHLNIEAMEPSELTESLTEMSSALDDLRSRIEQGDLDGALAALDAMEQGMQPLQDEMGTPGDPGQLSEFQRQMGELLEEAANLAELERAIEEETADVLEQARREGAERAAEQLAETFEEVQQRVEELRRQIDGLDPAQVSPDARQRLEDVSAGLERLERHVQEQDVAGCQEAAGREGRAMMEAAWFMQPRDDAADASGRRRAAREAERAERVMRDGEAAMRRIEQQMQALQQAAQPRVGSEGQSRMDRLAGEQRQASERLEALRRRAAEMSAEVPGLEDALAPSFDQARQSMQSAENRLRRGDAPGALESERSARQQLEALRQQMQQMSSRRPQGQRGRDVNRERVGVPEEGEPDRHGFRREVREAMRENRVESYEEDLQRYYERLVR